MNTFDIPLTLKSKHPFFSLLRKEKREQKERELLVTPLEVEFTFGIGDSMPGQTVDNSEIDNYSPELWQRKNIGIHTYIPGIILSIWKFYKSFIESE